MICSNSKFFEHFWGGARFAPGKMVIIKKEKGKLGKGEWFRHDEEKVKRGGNRSGKGISGMGTEALAPEKISAFERKGGADCITLDG